MPGAEVASHGSLPRQRLSVIAGSNARAAVAALSRPRAGERPSSHVPPQGRFAASGCRIPLLPRSGELPPAMVESRYGAMAEAMDACAAWLRGASRRLLLVEQRFPGQRHANGNRHAVAAAIFRDRPGVAAAALRPGADEQPPATRLDDRLRHPLRLSLSVPDRRREYGERLEHLGLSRRHLPRRLPSGQRPDRLRPRVHLLPGRAVIA